MYQQSFRQPRVLYQGARDETPLNQSVVTNNPLYQMGQMPPLQQQQQYYPQYQQQVTNKSNPFLEAFSHFPFLPSSMSKNAKGVCGLLTMIFFLIIIIVVLALIPVYINAAGSSPKVLLAENEVQEFSINLSNGIQLTDPPLARILEKRTANRTIEENASLERALKEFTAQLNSKIKPKLNSSNIEEIYNVRFRHKRGDLVDVSYTIRTKPVSQAVGTSIRAKLSEFFKEPSLYDEIDIDSGNGTAANTPLDKDSVSELIEGDFLNLSGNVDAEVVKPKLKENNSGDDNAEEVEVKVDTTTAGDKVSEVHVSPADSEIEVEEDVSPAVSEVEEDMTPADSDIEVDVETTPSTEIPTAVYDDKTRTDEANVENTEEVNLENTDDYSKDDRKERKKKLYKHKNKNKNLELNDLENGPILNTRPYELGQDQNNEEYATTQQQNYPVIDNQQNNREIQQGETSDSENYQESNKNQAYNKQDNEGENNYQSESKHKKIYLEADKVKDNNRENENEYDYNRKEDIKHYPENDQEPKNPNNYHETDKQRDSYRVTSDQDDIKDSKNQDYNQEAVIKHENNKYPQNEQEPKNPNNYPETDKQRDSYRVTSDQDDIKDSKNQDYSREVDIKHYPENYQELTNFRKNHYESIHQETKKHKEKKIKSDSHSDNNFIKILDILKEFKERLEKEGGKEVGASNDIIVDISTIFDLFQHKHELEKDLRTCGVEFEAKGSSLGKVHSLASGQTKSETSKPESNGILLDQFLSFDGEKNSSASNHTKRDVGSLEKISAGGQNRDDTVKFFVNLIKKIRGEKKDEVSKGGNKDADEFEIPIEELFRNVTSESLNETSSELKALRFLRKLLDRLRMDILKLTASLEKCKLSTNHN
jgi:hypothetical protein